MEKVQQLIADKRRECVELERESSEAAHRLEVAQIELRTLEHVAAVISEASPASIGNGIDPATSTAEQQAPVRRGMKTRWSLSEPYRRLVGAMIAQGNPPMYSYQIVTVAETVGLNLAPKQASSRFRRYVASGMAERVGEQYRLTASAVRTFEQAAR